MDYQQTKFQQGKQYSTNDWFTGALHIYRCISRTETTVKLSAVFYEKDGDHEIQPKTFDILNDNGREYILLYEYKGMQNRIYAE